MKLNKLDDLNATIARSGVTRRAFSGDNATLAFTTLEPGHAPNRTRTRTNRSSTCCPAN